MPSATVPATGLTAQTAGSGSSCSDRTSAQTPILLVHGFNSSSGAWDGSLDRFGADPGVCVEVFDYAKQSTYWVGNKDQNISSRLAAQVKTLSRISLARGGSGKVIVVAHSMGGLAIRCAASTACGGDDKVKSLLLDVITFDTPNAGTFWKSYRVGAVLTDLLGRLSSGATCYEPPLAQLVTRALGICKLFQAIGTSDAAAAFTPGSRELKSLPSLPQTVPVYGLAASVEVRVPLFLKTVTVTSVGDYVVARDSAKSAAHKVNGLGGLPAKDIDFGSITIGIRGIPSITYKGWHGTETTDKTFVSLATAEIARAVKVNLAQGGVTLANLLSAPVTAQRGTPAGHLTNGTLGGPGCADCLTLTTSGPFAPTYTDLTGDGIRDAAVVLNTTSGHGGLDQYISFYTKKGAIRRLADYFPQFEDPTAAHAEIIRMTSANGNVHLEWKTYPDGSGTWYERYWSAQLSWDGQKIRVKALRVR